MLKGVQNIAFSQEVVETPVQHLGKSFNGTVISGPTNVTAQIDKFLLNTDFVTGLLLTSDISGQFEYGGNTVDFSKAVINGYAVSANVGELPEISFDLSIYGGLKGGEAPIKDQSSPDDEIQNVPEEGILATFDKESTNALQSFSFSESYSIQPVYGIGNTEPSDLVFVGPVNQEASLTIEIDDYEFEETFSFLSGSKDRARNIKLQISGSEGILNTFQLENAHLVSESISASQGGTSIANLKYKGYRA